MSTNLPKKLDLLQFLPYGKITDYPVSYKDSNHHFGGKISINTQLPTKLTESELFNVICIHPNCNVEPFRFIPVSRFDERMSYSDWLLKHHAIKHPNSPQMFIVASFWSTAHNGHGYDVEYRLISLDDNQHIKPLNQIYASNDSNKPIELRCSYCHATNKSLRRCGGCKILHYCDTNCQKKHWNLIHKKECKKWKKKYKNKTLSQQELDDIDVASTLKLSKMATDYYGDKIELFREMLDHRTRVARNRKKEELLFDDDGTSRELIVLNTMMSVVIQAFDRDKDGKLNFKEWRCMMKELGFTNDKHFGSYERLFYSISEERGIIPLYDASLSNGSYGSYIYPEFDGFRQIAHGPRAVMITLRYCAYFRSLSKDNEDEDFSEEYDFDDEETAMAKAFRLLMKLYGHAQTIVCDGNGITQEEVYDVILEAVPCFDRDIASVIYNYFTFNGQHIINVSWHRIRWLNMNEDQEGLWNLYDKNSENQYYDLFYLSKTDAKGYTDTSIGIEICDDIEKCNRKLEKLRQGPFGFTEVDFEEKLKPKQRWCLGSCPSYIPDHSFTLREIAILIGKVLQFHNLNPKLCHYIYIGVGVNCSKEGKSKIVDAFNVEHGTNAKFRPHAPKKPDRFHDVLNFG